MVEGANWSPAEWELVREPQTSEYGSRPRDGGSQLAERFIAFGVGVLKLVNTLPNTFACRHIGGQLLRCGTSPGANYEEARGAESRNDFIHKMGVVLKELKESRYWLRVISAAELLSLPEVKTLLKEAEELCSIAAQSILTAKKNAR